MLTNSSLSAVLCASSFGVVAYLCYNSFFHSLNKLAAIDKEKLEKKIKDLSSTLLEIEKSGIANLNQSKEIRIWMDGVFDVMHYGHMNAFRQARALGTYLIIGVNSNESIIKCKGPPIMDDKERVDMVKSCKWVDEVVTDVPYIMNEEYIHYIINKYKVDYIVHGDDPCIVDGKDVYDAAVRLGKYLTVPRTEGVSTTDILGRILNTHNINNSSTSSGSCGFFMRSSDFFTTGHIFRMYSAGVKPPSKSSTVVYIAGTWDLLCNRHIRLLEEAKKYGDYVLVGIYNDTVINHVMGGELPLFNMQERALGILGCKDTGDILLDAPVVITEAMVKRLHISIVLVMEDEDAILDYYSSSSSSSSDIGEQEVHPLSYPKSAGIVRVCNIQETDTSTSTSTTEGEVVRRIIDQKEKFNSRFTKKKGLEEDFYANKYDLQTTTTT
eukprot:gene5193-10385_t